MSSAIETKQKVRVKTIRGVLKFGVDIASEHGDCHREVTITDKSIDVATVLRLILKGKTTVTDRAATEGSIEVKKRVVGSWKNGDPGEVEEVTIDLPTIGDEQHVTIDDVEDFDFVR